MANIASEEGRAGPTSSTGQLSGWVGWIGFAAIIMMLLGAFHVIQGIVAVVNDQYFLVTQSDLVLSLDFTAWGWTFIIGGAIVFAAGIGVLAGRMWARVVGVIVALLSALANMVFIAAYPIWSILMITLSVVVIWALTVHGREVTEDLM